MPKFQGSGFVVELPEGCIDMSAYTFVLPVKSGFSPNLVIRFEAVGKVRRPIYRSTSRKPWIN